ncbi:MAG: dTDP-glucose 4,6-dehydratase [Elusimicrobia bacterium]|nr:dTDP-glucose 4,6-dehydratase [Elusimicrobiota bacterium]
MKNIMVTGGAGFIGSNFIRYVFSQKDFKGKIINFDKLTYAGNLENLTDICEKYYDKRYFFIKGDICDRKAVEKTLEKYEIDTIVHFAAESHVDRSILGPEEFIKTNIEGTFILLQSSFNFWKNSKNTRFHHVSTDEVYGSLGPKGYFKETTPYDPRSPYSSSKAASDHLVRAYSHTYGLPVTVSNCSNNYGPYQFPEKLIPLIILNALEGKNLPIYGDGKNVRDWLYVEDHCSAIWTILKKGKLGETYNIGGECEKQNIEIVKKICSLLEEIKPSSKNPFLKSKKYSDLITFVKDRPGHDKRYAIDCSKIKKELGWKQAYDFDKAIRETIKWYISNESWVKSVKDGSYRNWLNKNYSYR